MYHSRCSKPNLHFGTRNTLDELKESLHLVWVVYPGLKVSMVDMQHNWASRHSRAQAPTFPRATVIELCSTHLHAVFHFLSIDKMSLDESRLATELMLLEAMYPGQIEFDARSGDLVFSDQSAHIQLRIPESYPAAGLPEVLSACDSMKQDRRNQVKVAIQKLGLEDGGEVLDAIIASFQSIIAQTNSTDDLSTATGRSRREPAPNTETDKTVIIWLHHLLALTKRKLALAPASPVAGITKPGYPGIMIFSGPASAVNEHVNTLKAENWQAFQVRYEEDVLWTFTHGAAVKEVETMAEVAKAVEVGEYSVRRKEDFLKAAGIK
jgi:hypothetical protein